MSVLFGALLAFIGARFVLCLVRADPENRIVSVIGVMTDPFVAPFEGILGLQHVPVGTGEHGAADWAALIAIAGYAILLALILALLGAFRRPRVVAG